MTAIGYDAFVQHGDQREPLAIVLRNGRVATPRNGAGWRQLHAVAPSSSHSF